MFVVWFPREMRHEWWYFACACAFPNSWWLIGAEPKGGAGLTAIMALCENVWLGENPWRRNGKRKTCVNLSSCRYWSISLQVLVGVGDWGEGREKLDMQYLHVELQSELVPHWTPLHSFFRQCFSSYVLSNFIPSWFSPSVGRCRKKWEHLNQAAKTNHLLAWPFLLVGHTRDTGRR